MGFDAGSHLTSRHNVQLSRGSVMSGMSYVQRFYYLCCVLYDMLTGIIYMKIKAWDMPPNNSVFDSLQGIDGNIAAPFNQFLILLRFHNISLRNDLTNEED